MLHSRVFNITNFSFNLIIENKIIAIISEFRAKDDTLHLPSIIPGHGFCLNLIAHVVDIFPTLSGITPNSIT